MQAGVKFAWSPLMEINLTTPALLFPAVSLLMLAYTNRFVVLANLIRSLYASYREKPDPVILGQIANLRLRVILIRNMQILGVSAILLSVLSMFLLFERLAQAATFTFGAGLVCLMASLSLSLWEIQISVNALNIQLSDLEERKREAEREAVEVRQTGT
jgi:hypothetical protein